MNRYSSKLVTAVRSHIVSIVALTLVATVIGCGKTPGAGGSITDDQAVTDAGTPVEIDPPLPPDSDINAGTPVDTDPDLPPDSDTDAGTPDDPPPPETDAGTPDDPPPPETGADAGTPEDPPPAEQPPGSRR